MSIRRGTQVRYKSGTGSAVGKVVRVDSGMATIKTARGALVRRKIDGLLAPDSGEDEASAPPTAVAPPDVLPCPEPPLLLTIEDPDEEVREEDEADEALCDERELYNLDDEDVVEGSEENSNADE